VSVKDNTYLYKLSEDAVSDMVYFLGCWQVQAGGKDICGSRW